MTHKNTNTKYCVYRLMSLTHILPIILSLIIPFVTNYKFTLSSKLTSTLINLICVLVGSIHYENTKHTYITFNLLWVVEAVFVVFLLFSGSFVKAKLRYFMFTACTFVLPFALYVVNYFVTENTNIPYSTLWLFIGGVQLVLVKRVAPKRWSSNEITSLGLGLWAAQCCAEFIWSLDRVSDPRVWSRDTALRAEWLVVAFFICALHFIWTEKKHLFDLKLEPIAEEDEMFVSRSFGDA